MSRTPDKNSPAPSPQSKVGHSTVASRIPAPSKTGNTIVDSDNEARRECFMPIVHKLLDKSAHIWPMFAELHKRPRDEAQPLNAPTGDTFTSRSTFGELDEDFVTQMVILMSDIVIEDIVAARQVRDKSLYQISQSGLRWPLSLKLPSGKQVKEVAKRVCLATHVELKELSRDFKKMAGFMQDGSVSWTNGVYHLAFDGPALVKLERFRSGPVDVPKALGISTACTLHSNWCECFA